ncbi:MAG TPA: hypothetical protein VGB53_15190 [Rubricoccaceae bacterium]|jgi:hypothetical protein
MPAISAFPRLALGLVLLTSVQSYLVIGAQFALDRDAIAARYCINRDRPELHCDGACELARRLDAQNEREDSREATLLGVALSATMWLAPQAALAPPPARPVRAHARPAGQRAARGTPDGIFHPPKRA